MLSDVVKEILRCRHGVQLLFEEKKDEKVVMGVKEALTKTATLWQPG